MHFQTHHSVAEEVPGYEREVEGRDDDTRTYRVVFPKKAGLRHCLVEGCSGQTATRNFMRVHLWHCYVWDTMLILVSQT